MPLVPPLNFAMVAPGVYRSGHPNRQNFPFLRKLGLKTVMYFAMEDLTPDMEQFMQEEGIEIFHYRTEGNKEPFQEISTEDINHALHRIGCLVGCLRKIQRWSKTSIFDEYRRFADTKVLADLEFIETFDEESVPYDRSHKPFWL
ncbi:tyrosine phosphatase family-domain-containing protein [Umbelopsis sp. PMI_123]|nr:tyrosine phosphatase family-domain-containing protein [Umbelopsis sp. PMI_123]